MVKIEETQNIPSFYFAINYSRDYITDNSCDCTVSNYQMPFSPLVDWEYLLIPIYIDTKLIRCFFFVPIFSQFTSTVIW